MSVMQSIDLNASPFVQRSYIMTIIIIGHFTLHQHMHTVENNDVLVWLSFGVASDGAAWIKQDAPMAHWTCATEAANACSKLKEERVAFMSHPLLWNSLCTGPCAGGHSHKPDSLQQPNTAVTRALRDTRSPAAKANVYLNKAGPV